MKSLLYGAIVAVVFSLFWSCKQQEEGFEYDDFDVVEQLFYEKWSTIGRPDLYRIFEQPMLKSELKAMKFLYAFMPLCDLADEPDTLFLSSVRAAFDARRSLPWGTKIPADVFRHFVLPLRVSDEDTLFTCRRNVYEISCKRMKSMNMKQAAEEILARHPTDQKAIVSLLRSVAIPAREVNIYPQDSSLARIKCVEVWIDGKWTSVGTQPTMRMAQTQVFGWYKGDEEILWADRCFTHLNLLPRYTRSHPRTIVVEDPSGLPFAETAMQISVWNGGRKYRLANRMTDGAGKAQLTVEGSGIETEVFFADFYTGRSLSFTDHAEHTEQLIVLSGGRGDLPSKQPNPRAEEIDLFNCVILPCRSVDREILRETAKNPPFLVSYSRQMALLDELNPLPVTISPEGVARLGITDTPSRSIFFVSVCLAAGIQAEIDSVTQQPRYRFDNKWHQVKW